MKRLWQVLVKKEPEVRKKRYFSGVSMRGQFQKMKKMNQQIISMSVGR